MKGARRTRKSRHQAGFADLMAPHHPSTTMRGVVTGVSRAQSTPSTPIQTIPDPTTPPPPDEDWGALLQTTPKRRISPQRPIVANTPDSNSSTPLSPSTTSHTNVSNPPLFSPTQSDTPPAPPPHIPTPSASSPQPANTASPSTFTAVPAFLSGWDGAEGWGDDPSLDDSDHDIQEDPWGAWPESDILFSSYPQTDPVTSSVTHPERSNSRKSERPNDLALDFTTASSPRPSPEEPNQPASPRRESTTELSYDDTTTSLKTSLPDPVEESNPIRDNKSPQLEARNELYGATPHTRAFTASSDGNFTTLPDEGVLTVPNASDERQAETLSEDLPLPAAVPSESNQPPEQSPHTDVAGGGEPDSCHQNDDFSGWNEGEAAQENVVEVRTPDTQVIQSEPQTTSDETKGQFEAQDKLLRDAVQEHVDTCVQAETKGDTAGLESVAGTDAEIQPDSSASAASPVALTDQAGDPSHASISIAAWGLEDTTENVPADEAGWGWSETDKSDTVKVIEENSEAYTSVIPNAVLPESPKRYSSTTNTASGERIDAQLITDDSAVASRERQESKPADNEVDPAVSLEQSAVPEEGWAFVEYPKEANTDDWGWGVQAEQDGGEFTVDVNPGTSRENAPISMPAQEASTQRSAYDLLHSSGQTRQHPRAEGGHSEDGDKSVKDRNMERSSQLSHGLESTDHEAPFEASRNSVWGNTSDVGAQQYANVIREADASFPVVADSVCVENAQGETTLGNVVMGSKPYEQSNNEGQAETDSLRTSEEDACGIDIRSTDVDLSSTVAGTDVPSVAAPSSVDEAEWEPDQNEFPTLNTSNSSDMAQKCEEQKSVAPDTTSSFLWNEHAGASQTDRSWANPDAMWSSTHIQTQSSVGTEGDGGRAAANRQETLAEIDNTVLPKGSGPPNPAMIGMVHEYSLRPPTGTSLSESASTSLPVEVEKFPYFREDHPEPSAIVNKTSYDQAETQSADVSEKATEVKKPSEEPGVSRLRPEDNVQSVPSEKHMAVADNVGPFYAPRGQNSNSYWTERLDQSTPQRALIQGDSNDKLLHASTDFLTTKPDNVCQEQTQIPSSDLQKAPVSVLETDVMNMPLGSSSRTTPSDRIEHPFATVPASRENQPVPEPSSQEGSGLESTLNASRDGNAALNSTSSPVHADAYSQDLDRSGETTELRTGKGPTSNGRSQSFQVKESFQWPAESFAFEDGDRANVLGDIQEGRNIDTKEKVLSDPKHDHDQGQAAERGALDNGTNLSDWNQYAPRVNSCPTPESPPQTASEVFPPAPAQSPTGKQQKHVSSMETASYDMATYDPFIMSQEDSTMHQAKDAYEAFDWSTGTQEPSRDAAVSLSTVSAVPQTSVAQSVCQPPKRVVEEGASEGITEETAVQAASLQKYDSRDASSLEVLLDSHATEAAPAAGEFRQDFASREVHPSEDEPGGMLTGRSPNARSTTGETSFGDDSGLERYAPRGAQPAELGSGIPMEDPSSSTGREPPDTSSTRENSSSLPYVAASTGLALLDSPFHENHIDSYQPQRAPKPSPNETDLSYAPSEPPIPTSTSGRSGDVQSRQKDAVVASPANLSGAVLSPEEMDADHLAVTRPPQPATSDLAARESLGSGIPSRTKPEAQEWSQSHTEYQGDHATYQTNAFSYAPMHKEIPQQKSDEVVNATTEFKQYPLSLYNTEEKPMSLSETRQTDSSSTYAPQVGYENVTTPLQSQPESDVSAAKDTFMQAQGAYEMPGDFSLGFNVPSPPQPAPLPPTSIPAPQEGFPAESILDPSTFSYPYSILDTETSGDLSYRPQRPLISWGFGGKLVTVIPPVNAVPKSTHAEEGLSAEGKGSSTVHIHDLTAIAQDGSNDDWAAASEAVSPLSLPVRPPDLLIYADMCDRLSKLSVGLSGSESEGRAAMWRILALLCRQGTSDWRINAPTAICGPSSVPMFGGNDSSSFLSGKSHVESPLRQGELISRTSERERGEPAAEVERLLTEGNGTEAIRVAQEAGLWSIALVLAATIDKSLYMRAVSEFAKATLQDGSALQTLCLLTAEDEAEILRKATSPSGLKEWRKTVGMLLTTRGTAPNTGEGQYGRFLQLIDQVGEALITQRNDVVAGHVCFLLSGRLGPLNSSSIPLLGADSKLPAGRPRSMGSSAVILQSLVLEAIANAQNGAMYPHILPFRLLLAEEVCSVGRPDVALTHCESISSAVRGVFESGRKDIASKFFTLPFLSRLESLEQRLRIHLGIQEIGEKKGTLSALGKSLSSVFTRSSTADSRSTQMNSRETATPSKATAFPGHQGSPQLQSSLFTPQPLPAVSPVDPRQRVADSQWTPKFEPSQLQPLPVETSRGTQPEIQSADKSGNERWNSLVSKTIGFIAPADGDLSPPLKARGDQGVPFHAQPTPLGLGTGPGSRAPSHDPHVGHMRSASVGDVPVMQSQGPMFQAHGQGNYSHHGPNGPQSQRGHPHDSGGKPVDQAMFEGAPVQKATTAESGVAPTHRRSASDMTFESQTSEKKPPRPPKKSSTLPQGAELLSRKETVPVAKGWRSRLSEKIRAAFSGPPRAHMGVENKFKYDKARGRWVMEGEDPNEDDDTPPPPPDDDAMVHGEQKVPFSQSYESLPNPDLNNHFVPHSHGAEPQSADALGAGITGGDSFRRYSHDAQFGYSSSKEHTNARDTGSESSVASAASAPVPYSSQTGIPTSANPGNKFRAHPGRLSGRRAYVDTFNKGTSNSTSTAMPHTARPGMPGMPGMPGLGSTGGSGYRIFTPTPAAPSGGLGAMGPNGHESGSVPGTSSAFDSSDRTHDMHAEAQTNNGQQPSDSFEYGLPKPAPMPSVEKYQANGRNEQPRLMA